MTFRCLCDQGGYDETDLSACNSDVGLVVQQVERAWLLTGIIM